MIAILNPAAAEDAGVVAEDAGSATSNARTVRENAGARAGGVIIIASGVSVLGGIKDGGLAGSDGALRREEADVRTITRKRAELGKSGGMAMANLDAGADRFIRRGGRSDGDPIHLGDDAFDRFEFAAVTDDDAIGGGIEFENIKRAAGGKAQALALADGKILQAGVAAQNFA